MATGYRLDKSAATVIAVCAVCGARRAGLDAAQAVRLIRQHRSESHDTRGKTGN